LRTIFLLLFAPLCLHAQRRSIFIDVGAARMRFADSIDATALSVNPTVRLNSPRGSVDASVTLSSIGGAMSNFGLLSANLVTDRAGLFAGEVEATTGGSFHSDGTRTGQLLGFARMHVTTSSRGAWLGGGVGATWDGAWREVLQGDAGGWLSRGSSLVSLRLSPTIVDDSIRYSDAFVSGHQEWLNWEFDASFGARAGDPIPTLPANRSIWGSAGATYWATNRLGIVAGAGVYPVDFTQGFPGGRYISLSVRIRPATVSMRPVEPPDPQLRTFQLHAEGGDTYRIRVRAPSARVVEVKGDFTLWRAVPLDPESGGGGWWSVALPISRGTHEVNVRVDGGAWSVPPGLTPLRDEFGGRVGLLVVPP
jgi:hypothetical protein